MEPSLSMRPLCSSFAALDIWALGYDADGDVDLSSLDSLLNEEEDGKDVDDDLLENAFSCWEPFMLCHLAPTEDGEESEVILHPTNNGRFAIPILSDQSQSAPTIITNELLSLFDERRGHRLNDAEYQKTVNLSLGLWRYCLKYTASKSSFSLNEMLGTLALLYSILQWLRLYSFSSMTSQYVEDRVCNSSIYFAYLSCVDAFHRCNSELTKRIETADKEIAVRWQQALQKTGYDPQLLLSLPFSLPCP
ncbi:hypothetical protein V8E54_012395 [Elaphomyces granulatus]